MPLEKELGSNVKTLKLTNISQLGSSEHFISIFSFFNLLLNTAVISFLKFHLLLLNSFSFFDTPTLQNKQTNPIPYHV